MSLPERYICLVSCQKDHVSRSCSTWKVFCRSCLTWKAIFPVHVLPEKSCFKVMSNREVHHSLSRSCLTWKVMFPGPERSCFQVPFNQKGYVSRCCVSSVRQVQSACCSWVAPWTSQHRSQKLWVHRLSRTWQEWCSTRWRQNSTTIANTRQTTGERTATWLNCFLFFLMCMWSFR